jgi:hypothetical protein
MAALAPPYRLIAGCAWIDAVDPIITTVPSRGNNFKAG